MSLLGVHLTLWMGPGVPTPASLNILEALDEVEVTQSDTGQSGFQITFRVGRSETDALDYALLSSLQLRPFSRVVLMVTFNAIPRVLMDGIITSQELAPNNKPGASRLTVTGEDVSAMMDQEEKLVEHPALDEGNTARKIILTYAQYGLIPGVVDPPVIDPPLPIDRTPVQQGTDLTYLREMAGRFAYVFYVTPGPAPLMNTAYWGPPKRTELPQRTLSVNMGPDSNVDTINFQFNARAAQTVSSSVQDRTMNQVLPVQTFASTRIPMATQPGLLTYATSARKRVLDMRGCLTYQQAFARAQAMTDTASDAVVSASGELDAARYGELLKPRGLVDLRGAGYSNDGTYYVKSVTHKIRRGQYKQNFTLSREGIGALSPVVQTQ